MNEGVNISGIIVDISTDSPSSLPEGSMRLRYIQDYHFKTGNIIPGIFAGEEVAAKIS